MSTEKEKVQKGELYDANYDSELQGEMLATRCRLFEFNSMPPGKIAERESILRSILNIGSNFCILSPFHCDYGSNITIGNNFFANVNLVILDGAKVVIGDNVFIAPNVGIYTAGHPLDVELRRKGLEYALPIEIGNDVWIGGGVSILPGVRIGDGSVIGAGSVVNRDIPAHVVAAGNPCKVIKKLSDE